MSTPLLTSRTRLARHPERGAHDRETVYRILDEGMLCHVGFVADGQPYVIPASYGRIDDALYLHGGAVSRLLRTLESGAPACVTVSLLDGIVLGRSAMHHSVNFRSVVLIGRATAVADRAEKLRGLRAISEHLIRGRWDHVREPSERELAVTTVVKLPITEASAKIRAGPPVDDPRDLDSDVWAGVLPLGVVVGTPVPDAATGPARDVPDHVKGYSRRRA